MLRQCCSSQTSSKLQTPQTPSNPYYHSAILQLLEVQKQGCQARLPGVDLTAPQAVSNCHGSAPQSSHSEPCGLLYMGYPAAEGSMKVMASVNLHCSPAVPLHTYPHHPHSHTIPGASGPSDPTKLTSSLLGMGEALDIQCRILALYTPVYLSKLQVPLDKTILWDFSAVPPCAWACHTELTAPKC